MVDRVLARTPADKALLEQRANAYYDAGRLDQVIGRPLWELPWLTGTPGMSEAARQAVATAASGQDVRQEIQLNLPEGGLRWFDFSLRSIRDAQE